MLRQNELLIALYTGIITGTGKFTLLYVNIMTLPFSIGCVHLETNMFEVASLENLDQIKKQNIKLKFPKWLFQLNRKNIFGIHIYNNAQSFLGVRHACSDSEDAVLFYGIIFPSNI